MKMHQAPLGINAATVGPPDRVKMAEIMSRYGLTPAP